MSIKIALAGNPNCGKTTMFNELTGSSQYVGNWPGVTVEKKEGKLKWNKEIKVIDLPGIYSLSPYTLEEVVTREYILEEKPDVIINLIDGSNIERNLYLTTQILEMGIPVVIALNMIDIVQKKGDKINIDELSLKLGCQIIETSALKSTGLKNITAEAITAAKAQKPNKPFNFGKSLENCINKASALVPDSIEINQRRWYAIKLLEKDEEVFKKLGLSQDIKLKINNIVSDCEAEFDDDIESIITNERYLYIEELTKLCVKKKNTTNFTTSDKIDMIITNRFLALPIFAAIMWLVYYISVSTVGSFATDWVNDVLFAQWLQGGASNFLASINCSPLIQGLVVDGIIGGVGAVLGFLPQMLVLFFFLAILEDCGYMSRIAFIMDKIFHKFGLSGKSFIPILIGTGCGVPGIMASRTIENDKDRKMTIITTTFIPCGAKLPIIALISGALFQNATWVAPSAYFLGIFAIIFSGIILKKTLLFDKEPAPFVMELPEYHLPGAKGVLIHMWDKGKSFVIKAGTIIFVACGLIWFFQTFNWTLEQVDPKDSMLAAIGGLFAPIFSPLGFGDWRSSVACITGLVAKENVVATLGVLFGASGEISESGLEVWSNLQTHFTSISAYAFLAFNLLCAPCFAAIGAIKREMGSWKWTLIAVGYQTFFAYIVALLINQLGSAIFLGTSFVAGISVLFAVTALVSYLIFRNTAKEKSKESNIPF